MGLAGSRIVTQCLDQLNSRRVFYFTNGGAYELADILEKLVAGDTSATLMLRRSENVPRGIGFVTTSQPSLFLVVAQLLQCLGSVRILRVQLNRSLVVLDRELFVSVEHVRLAETVIGIR